MTTYRFGSGSRPRMAVAPLALLLACPAFVSSAGVSPAQAADGTAPSPLHTEDVTGEPTKIHINRYGWRAFPAQRVEPVAQSTPPTADAADFLRSQPGVTAGRMGGHGLELTIRGQSQDRLAIIDDGSYTFGGCPNRMDPPASAAALEAADVVIVQRGYQSVLNGPPAPGGTVSLERATPSFTEPGVTGRISAGLESELRQGSAKVTAGAATGYASAHASVRKADDYEDGDGREVRSSFRQRSAGMDVGWTYAPGSVLGLSAERDEVDDALFAGAGMDSPRGDTTVYRLNWRHEIQSNGPVSLIEGGLYRSNVDHLMDNYSLRPVTAPMKMRTLSWSNTWGGRLAAELAAGPVDLTIGVDHRTNERDAVMYGGMAMMPGDPAIERNFLWPGMTIADTGLFAQGEMALAARTNVTVGARVDWVRADASEADRLANGGAMTARQLYTSMYGASDVSQEETNLSGFARVEQGLGDGVTGWLGASRAVRTADASERGMARNSGLTASTWVGNPNIAPEKHHQIDVGVQAGGTAWRGEIAAWSDWVEDYITRDTARGQAGILRANGESIYRNVDAHIAGIEVNGSWNPWSALRLSGDAVYTWGQNTTDDRALYQIPPLQGTVEVAWEPGTWSAGTRMRWAMTQTRVDLDATSGSGLDPRKTPGYAVFDLFASYAGFTGLELRGGVTNLFDDAYASHLSRSNSVDPVMVQVNEPGRSFYLQGIMEF